MRTPISIASLVCAAALATGCADVRPGQPPTAQQRAASQALVQEVDALAVLSAADTDGDVLLRVTDFSPLLSLLAPAGTAAVLPSRRADDADLSECMSAGSSGASFAECVLAEHVIDGTVSTLPGSVDASLVDVFILGPDTHGAATVEARLSRDVGLADTAVSGSVEVDVMWTLGDVETVLDAGVRADELILDASGCATSGMLTVSGGISGAPSSAQTFLFGPGCGDVLVTDR